MLEEFVPIHPLDLGALFTTDPDPVEVHLVHQKDSSFHGEYVEYRGKKYRQTVEVPVVSEYGKTILAGGDPHDKMFKQLCEGKV